MKLIRIIPLLLVSNNILVKGKNFKNHDYIGDVYNAVKIFSEKKGFKKYFDRAMDWVFYEDDELALGETYIKENFGYIKIYSEQKLLELNIFDINGKSVLSHNLKLSKL